MKRFRKIKGLTQEELAIKADTATNYIGTIEIGKKFPSPKMIEKIAKALEIDELELFSEETSQKSLPENKHPALLEVTKLTPSQIAHIQLIIDDIAGN